VIMAKRSKRVGKGGHVKKQLDLKYITKGGGQIMTERGCFRGGHRPEQIPDKRREGEPRAAIRGAGSRSRL